MAASSYLIKISTIEVDKNIQTPTLKEWLQKLAPRSYFV
jgi:hypothetical protein